MPLRLCYAFVEMSSVTYYSKSAPVKILKIFNVYSSLTLNNLKIVRNGISSTNLATNKICWKCGKNIEEIKHICDKCNTIQAPTQKHNYFKVLGIQEKFDIDPKSLRDKFRDLQNVLHPDKFSNKSQDEQTISEEYSSLVNKAYSNLQTPLKRAEHLLKLKGENVEEDQTLDDSEFLMQMMILNEEVDDAGDDVVKLKTLNEKNRKELEKLEQATGESFTHNDIKSAKNNIIKMKYFTSISNRLNKMLRELGVTD